MSLARLHTRSRLSICEMGRDGQSGSAILQNPGRQGGPLQTSVMQHLPEDQASGAEPQRRFPSVLTPKVFCDSLRLVAFILFRSARRSFLALSFSCKVSAELKMPFVFAPHLAHFCDFEKAAMAHSSQK
mmetsp:Transcript_67023/g.146939  ORF Transcript_67023/g.146939 Transcript_67023/m.146939 type:complete len:129 (+) Transcript_67023:105-491(+)